MQTSSRWRDLSQWVRIIVGLGCDHDGQLHPYRKHPSQRCYHGTSPACLVRHGLSVNSLRVGRIQGSARRDREREWPWSEGQRPSCCGVRVRSPRCAHNQSVGGAHMSDWFSKDQEVKHGAFRRIAAMVCPAAAPARGPGCDERKLAAAEVLIQQPRGSSSCNKHLIQGLKVVYPIENAAIQG
jgi:hypothetical protein